MKLPLLFHERQCVEILIRLLEKRTGAQRGALSQPEKENHSAPIDCLVSIGETYFAIEHTGIEPFEKHIELSSRENKQFDPIISSVAGRLPPGEHFVLHIDALALSNRDRRALESLQRKIVDWIEVQAPTLPVARHDLWITDLHYSVLAGTSINLALHRVSTGGPRGQLSVVHLVSQIGFEEKRKQRILRALIDHRDKLAWWKNAGARTIFILEENDMWLSNNSAIARAYRKVEEEISSLLPDEVYLFGTSDNSNWFLNALRVGGYIPVDLSVSGGYAWEIDPATSQIR